jgi:hypothetical protein
MRNTRCMADYSEVELGYGMLSNFFFRDHNRDAFYKALDACSENVAQESIALFNHWWADIRFNTYICSISEHENNEDDHGRLSMWRAFGQSTSRAAMVMQLPADDSVQGLRVLFSPVAYFDQIQVEQQLWKVIQNINDNCAYLASLDRDRLKGAIFYTLVSAAVSIKHVGFDEEKEWRVIYLPKANPSDLIKPYTVVLGGVPQIIHKIPLEENPEKDVNGIGLPALLNRIIIGPTVYDQPMKAAFIEALAKAGFPHPEDRVVVSGIPIRS